MCENLPNEIEGVSIGDFPSAETIDYRFTWGIIDSLGGQQHPWLFI